MCMWMYATFLWVFLILTFVSSLDIDTVNTSSGLLKAAVAREARYTYVGHPQFKSGTYKGMWFDGVPHGR